jgi:hypothetical protein
VRASGAKEHEEVLFVELISLTPFLSQATTKNRLGLFFSLPSGVHLTLLIALAMLCVGGLPEHMSMSRFCS